MLKNNEFHHNILAFLVEVQQQDCFGCAEENIILFSLSDFMLLMDYISYW